MSKFSMPKSRKHAAHLSSTPDDIESSFYEALQAGNLERLMACWSDEDDIVCIHPGGPRAVGAAAIRATFEAMFSDGGAIQAHPQNIRRVDAMACAVHSVLEQIEVLTAEGPAHAYALATNVYHKTPQGWRMVVHHASPGSLNEAQEAQRGSQVLH
jgi:ketosteroid isomerase-like protein